MTPKTVNVVVLWSRLRIPDFFFRLGVRFDFFFRLFFLAMPGLDRVAPMESKYYEPRSPTLAF